MHEYKKLILGTWKYEKTGRCYTFREGSVNNLTIQPDENSRGRLTSYTLKVESMENIALVIEKRSFVITNIISDKMYLLTDKGRFIELRRL